MKVLRTPDERFANLPGFPYEPHYVEVRRRLADALRRRGAGRSDPVPARRAVVVLLVSQDGAHAGASTAA